MSLDLLVTAAISVVTPYLVELGKGAAKMVGGEAAKPVLDWMRVKLGGPAKTALVDLEREPENQETQVAFKWLVKKALEGDPALADELRGLLPSGAVERARQATLIVSGDNATVAQVVGSVNKTSVRSGD